MRLLLLLLLAAVPLSALEPRSPRQPYPDDYIASPCAPSAEAMCGGVKKVDFANLAFRFRGVTIDHGWIDAHWDEMKKRLAPFCSKMSNCYTMRGNDTVWCQDLFRRDFVSTCDRFPEGSADREQCVMFATVYFITIPVKTHLFTAAQECAQRNGDWSSGRLEAWITPREIALDSSEPFTVHAIDAKRRVPIRATITIDGGGLIEPTDGPYPMTSVPISWQRRLRRIPNAEGHTDVVAPTITIHTEGFEPLQLALPVIVPKVKVAMTPSPAALRQGVQTVTITAHDTATGEPVEMRVMGDGRILGNTNAPFELTIDGAVPEIWLTSLFDLYSDVVVVPEE